MRIRKNDIVVVIAGKDRNKTGKVLRTLSKANRVVVEGVNTVTRHVRKTKARAGQRVQFEAPIHASNVMLLDPKTKKATRLGISRTKDGKKQRLAKKSNSVL